MNPAATTHARTSIPTVEGGEVGRPDSHRALGAIEPPPTSGRGGLGAARATVFLAAFLAFSIQPLIARYHLPTFGGGSSIWTTCLLFFQATLALGYAYAHCLSTWLSPRRQVQVHTTLLALSIATLPWLTSTASEVDPATEPTVQLLGALAAGIGLPFLLLTATSPLTQAWAARRYGDATYRLYGLSNLGSLLGLLAYPFLLEPLVGLSSQFWIWCGIYLALVASVVSCMRALPLSTPGALLVEDTVEVEGPGIRLGGKALWLLLPACSSILLTASTGRITQNVAPVPLLWALPFALYLLAFAQAFDGRPGLGRRTWAWLGMVSVAGCAWTMNLEQALSEPDIWIQIALYSSAVYCLSRSMLGELHALRPKPAGLTAYYLTLSVGGAAGAAFVALLAPRLFDGYFELHVAYVTSLTLIGASQFTRNRRRPGASPSPAEGTPRAFLPPIVWAAGLLGATVFLLRHARAELDGALLARRSFHGALSVYEQRDNGIPVYRRLYHGNICHGDQSFRASNRGRPGSYYGPDTGVGLGLNLHPARERGEMHIGAIGLGTGTLAAFGEAGDRMKFYEIDPLVEEIARHQFRYLADSRARVDVVLGDARVALRAEAEEGLEHRLDALVVDAFSGDSIPVHLVTREAFDLYWKHLAEDGALIFHTTNRYLELSPVIAALSNERGLRAVVIERDGMEGNESMFWSEWVVVTRNRALLHSLDQLGHSPLPEDTIDPAAAWSDDRTRLLATMLDWF